MHQSQDNSNSQGGRGLSASMDFVNQSHLTLKTNSNVVLLKGKTATTRGKSNSINTSASLKPQIPKTP